MHQNILLLIFLRLKLFMNLQTEHTHGQKSQNNLRILQQKHSFS